jgi:hypothetical protein
LVAIGLSVGLSSAQSALMPVLSASPSSSSGSPILLRVGSSATVTITADGGKPERSGGTAHHSRRATRPLTVSLSEGSSASGFAIMSNGCKTLIFGQKTRCSVIVGYQGSRAPAETQTATLTVSSKKPRLSAHAFFEVVGVPPLALTNPSPSYSGDAGTVFAGSLEVDSAPTGGSGGYSFAASGAPAGFQLDPDGAFVYRPDRGGRQSFPFTVTDGIGDTVQGTFTINAAPPFGLAHKNLSYNAVTGVALTGNLRTDAAPFGGTGGYIVSATGAPSGFQLQPGGAFSYTPANPGSQSFPFSVRDSLGDTAHGTVTINATHDVFTLAPHALTFGDDMGDSASGNLLSGDSASSGNPVTLTSISPTLDAASSPSASISNVTASEVNRILTISSTTFGEIGTLTVNLSDGAFAFTIDPSTGNAENLASDLSLVFDAQVADAAASATATEQLSITINADSVTIADALQQTLADDPGGTATGNLITDTGATTAHGTLTLASVGFDPVISSAGLLFVTSTSNTFVVLSGTTDVLTLVINPTTGAYTVTIDPGAESLTADAVVGFEFTIANGLGDSDPQDFATGMLSVIIKSDAPVATP